jgi:dienelactone hydrolase
MIRHYATLFLALLLHIAGLTAQTSNFCDPNNCLLWAPQPETIDSTVVTYAQQVWSIDEWDNAAGCTIPILNVSQCENLNMLVYSPAGLAAGEKRPLVVLIHGGGFISGDYTAFQSTAKQLASLGYVAATINYRLCKRNNCLVINNTGCLNLCNANFIADFATGAYVANYDARKAIQYLQQNAAQFHIDPDQLIVGGHSAGAWTAMNVAFMDQAEANAINPGWQSTWGSIEPVTGLKGVICMSGAVIDTNLIDADENYPVFVLHGTCDPTVCYDYDAAFHCNNSYPKIFGGARIASRLKTLGHAYYMFSGLGMGHDIGPLQDIWVTEAIRYMRSAMLCGNFIQKHSMATLDPGSAECTLLASDIPGCNLQHNHAQLPSVNLPVSAYWGGYPVPCGNGLVSTNEAVALALVTVQPTLATDLLSIQLNADYEDVTISIHTAQGHLLLQKTVPSGTTSLSVNQLPNGIYFLQAKTADGRLQTVRFVKI